jgi:hypothetical protein
MSAGTTWAFDRIYRIYRISDGISSLLVRTRQLRDKYGESKTIVSLAIKGRKFSALGNAGKVRWLDDVASLISTWAALNHQNNGCNGEIWRRTSKVFFLLSRSSCFQYLS